ncbi:MAG: bifunctional D-glycero-beta-D-manno-heptose-7-phosphate kinase/D-glycero-beta-D-manno-heptose 1-phosphate adenylyltransferase HldE [Gammaproteobacteria bacterium]
MHPNTLDFSEARVLVVGDIMLDSYWFGNTSRISPEAAVPIVHVRQTENRPGGAANVALNISSLGSQVTLLGFTGNDSESEKLETALEEANVNCAFLDVPNLPTINKIRIISRNQQMLRLDFEEKFHAENVDLTRLLELYEELLPNVDVVILSDYAKGTLNIGQDLINLANAYKIPVLIDPKSKDFSIYSGATIITPNLDEFEAVVGPISSEEDLVAKAEQLCKKYDFQAVLVTRGAQGMSLICPDEMPLHLPTKAREVFDVTGAGDTVIGVLGAALAAGNNLASATTLANTAAGITVKKLGAATVSPAELRRAMQRQEQDPEAGILSEEELLIEVAEAKNRGETIVMTNGCFDILHAGHVSYLEEAKSFGTRLIVAVNDDASVQRLKGPERPINSLEQRMLVLSALRSVDWVVPFSEDTPERIIANVAPDVLVKGNDYKVDEIAGAKSVLDRGGRVETVPLLEGFSTSGLLKQIQDNES